MLSLLQETEERMTGKTQTKYKDSEEACGYTKATADERCTQDTGERGAQPPVAKRHEPNIETPRGYC